MMRVGRGGYVPVCVRAGYGILEEKKRPWSRCCS